MKKSLIMLLCMVIYLVTISCTTTKSRFINQSNEIIGGVNVLKVESPKLYKKRSFLTEAVTYAPIAGGIAWGITEGKNLEIEDKDTGLKKPIGEFSGAIIGGLGGYVASYLIKSARPKNQVFEVNSSNYAKWLSKQRNFKNNYVGVPNNGYASITFFPKESYRQFVAKNVYELDLYRSAFGNVGEEGLIDRSLKEGLDENFLKSLYNFSSNDFNKSRVGKKYILSTDNYYEFVDRSQKYIGIKKEEIPSLAASRVNIVESAVAFKNSFPLESTLHNQIFNKLLSTLNRIDLIKLLNSYPTVSKHQEGIEQCLSLSKSLNEFTSTLSQFPQSGIAIPKNPITIKEVEMYDAWMRNKVSKYVSAGSIYEFRKKFQEDYFNNKLKYAATTPQLQGLEEELKTNAWILAGIKGEIINKISSEIEHNLKVDRLAVAREEFGDAAPLAFASIYPNDRETLRLLPELEQLTKKYIKVEEAGIWTGIGNHTMADGIMESFDGVKLGGQYNIFVWGILSNSLDFPIKVDIVSTLNYSNTAGVSIFTSTTQKTWNQSYQAEVPAKGKIPFAVVYKDFRTGGTIGSGLLSAGSVSSINRSNPYTLSFKYYNGVISEEQKTKQKEFISRLIKKGNIEVNDSEEEKNQRTQTRIANRIQHEKDAEKEKKEDELKEAKEKDEQEGKHMIAENEKEKEQTANESEKIKNCITKANSSLSKASFEEAGNWTKLDCPCVYYEDSSFFGTMLRLKYDNKKQWYYIVPSLFWTIPEGPFVSKEAALRGVCEKWYKEKK
jgi:hypothetical protein